MGVMAMRKADDLSPDTPLIQVGEFKKVIEGILSVSKAKSDEYIHELQAANSSKRKVAGQNKRGRKPKQPTA